MSICERSCTQCTMKWLLLVVYFECKPCTAAGMRQALLYVLLPHSSARCGLAKQLSLDDHSQFFLYTAEMAAEAAIIHC